MMFFFKFQVGVMSIPKTYDCFVGHISELLSTEIKKIKYEQVLI